MTASVYSMGEKEGRTSTTHIKSRRKKNVFSGLFLSSLVSQKAVFHRKKVVQLSLNNHCHAILKNVFCFSPDYDSCGLVFPPFFILPSKWCLRINCEWQEGKHKIQNVDAPFPFSSLLFFFVLFSSFSIMENIQFPFPDFPFFLFLATCFLDNYF